MASTEDKHVLSRRGFLAASASVAALAAASTLPGGKLDSAFVEAHAAEVEDEDWVYSYCRNCISPYCGLKVHRKNGVVVGLEGDPDWPLNRGRLCPRGNANIDALYNPFRVKAPMKRTNPEKAIDNDPGWVEISWDEAIDTCVEKLSAIQKDDPNKLVVARGFGAIWDDMPMFRPLFGVAFGTATATEVNGPLCPFHYGAMVSMGSFTSAADLKRCNYMVTFGGNYGGEFTRANVGADCLFTSTALLQQALDRGMKLISFDPHTSGDTKSTGEWIPIKPGMDLPIVLAFIEVVMCELGTYDEEFVNWRTNFPYLILPDRNYCRDAESNKPLIWDTVLGRALPFDSAELTAPALEGSFEVNGQTVHPAFQLIKEYVADFTPERVEEITGVSADKIRDIAHNLVKEARIGSTIQLDGFTFPYRPACVHYGRGATAHKGGLNFMLAVNIIDALLGAIDVPGGMVSGSGFGELIKPGADGTVEPRTSVNSHATEWIDNDYNYPTKSFDLSEYYPHRHSTPHVAWRAIVDPEKYYMAQDAEAIWVWGANPFVNNVNNAQVIEAFKKVPFVIDIAYNFDETSQFADILLAESSPLERTAFCQVVSSDLEGDHRGVIGINFRSPVCDLIYNTRTGGSVIAEIANKMGMTPKMNGMFAKMAGIPDGSSITTAGPKPHTFEEMCEILLKANYGEDKSLDDCLHNGSYFVLKNLPESQTYNYYYYPGRQTRVSVWEDHLFQSGLRIKAECEKRNIGIPGWDMDEYLSYYQPIPEWHEHPEHQAPAEYDMFVVNWKTAGRAQAMGVAQAPVLREVQAYTDPNMDKIVINRITAEKKGIHEGDTVLVESQYGSSLTGQVHLSDLIETSCLGFSGNYGHVAPKMGKYAMRGLNYNQLLNADDGNFDPASGGMENTAACKISLVKQAGGTAEPTIMGWKEQ